MNTNKIEVKSMEDLRLLNDISRILDIYNRHPQEEIEMTKYNIYGEPYTMVYPAGNIARNYERITKVRGYKGYVVLDDDTIMSITSSWFVAQYDGCKEKECELGFYEAIKGN